MDAAPVFLILRRKPINASIRQLAWLTIDTTKNQLFLPANNIAMGAGKSNTLIMADLEDLQKLISDEVANAKFKAMLNRYSNVLVGTSDVAHIHAVNERTVLNYIKDGLIVPEEKVSENDHHRFRLSDVLMLDFKELRKQLRARTRGW